jgi:hypothetical protein
MSPSLFRQIMRLAFVLIVASYSYWLGRSAAAIPCAGDNIQFSSDVPVARSTTRVESSSSSSGSYAIPQSYMSAWEESTVIVTISFGNATQTILLERLLYSIQLNGQWQGRVVVLTDHAEYYHTQQQLAALYPKLSIIQAKPEHLYPKDPKTDKPLPFITEAMRFKRFKTLILDYLDEHYSSSSPATSNPSSSSFQHVLYLDVEIVVARPIHGLLQDYLDVMIEREVFLNEYAHVNSTATPPFMSFFPDCAKCARQNFNLNGGVFVLHHVHSRACLAEWQHLFAMGADYVKYDQRYLVVMKQKRDKQQQQQPNNNMMSSLNLCKFWELPAAHRLYPNRKDMRVKHSATVVHNTNTYNAKKIPLHVQQAYFGYLLNTTAFTTDRIELF